MTLRVYNTATRQKEDFRPIDPEHIKMYVCGPTVYNLIHIGNARPAVVFDVLFRVLQNEYPQVTYARNITDIDDKIIKAARENGEAIAELSARYAKQYQADTDALGTLQPTIVPYATDHIPHMIALIERLLASNHAYVAEGHVLFDVQSMANYGELSNRSLEDMLDGVRVEVAPYKKYAGDFVLWKPSSTDEPGWQSPWGYGRPGWHLECSAMIAAHLGDSIDIHGGGRDLIFPHHENELAQSCCVQGCDSPQDWVRYWMHNGYVNIDGEKMSKSLGNFRTVRELLNRYRGEVIRFALLSAQYRSELDFSHELLEQSRASLDSLYGFLRDHADVEVDAAINIKSEAVYQALLDDLNTPVAISELYALSKGLSSASSEEKVRLKSIVLKAGELLGLLQQDPDHWFQQTDGDGGLSAEEIESLIAERQQAKLDKNYARADQIRQHLDDQGVLLEDSREGTRWKRKS